MNRIISYRGQLSMSTQDTINLHTNDGKTGYKIHKFQIMSSTPGVGDVEFVAQIYKTEETSNINTTPDFTNSRLLAVIYYQDGASQVYPSATETIFDLEVFNQDIYVNITSPNSSTVKCNYYIELEQIDLSEDQALVAIVKNIRNEQ